MFIARTAKFGIGQVVRHRSQGFRGVVIDVDPEYGGRTAWLAAATEGERPDLDQPFYHLLAEAGEDSCIAYVSEENLEADDSGHRSAIPSWPSCSPASSATGTSLARRW